MKELLTNEQILKLNEYLTLQYPGNSIEIEGFSDYLNLNFEHSKIILANLANSNILLMHFKLTCDNDIFDFIHTYKFNSFKDLMNFVMKSKAICPECNSKLLEENTEVYFVIPPNSYKKVISYE